MGHKWVYLGNYEYQCQECGLKVHRDDLVSGNVPECLSSVKDRLKTLEAQIHTANKQLQLIEAKITKLEGVT